MQFHRPFTRPLSRYEELRNDRRPMYGPPDWPNVRARERRESRRRVIDRRRLARYGNRSGYGRQLPVSLLRQISEYL